MPARSLAMLMRKRANIRLALATVENRIEDMNRAGDFEGGINLVAAGATLSERLAVTEQKIWIELEKEFT